MRLFSRRATPRQYRYKLRQLKFIGLLLAMYFTFDSLLPENQQPLMITVAPYGPQWLPEDYPEDIAVSWKDQVQKAVDCYNAGATILHVHVRDPKSGHVSKNFAEY